jgi:hypothetical protein
MRRRSTCAHDETGGREQLSPWWGLNSYLVEYTNELAIKVYVREKITAADCHNNSYCSEEAEFG